MSEQRTVWLREIIADHAPSYGEAIFSAKELAKASVPHVKEWVPDGDDGCEIEASKVGSFGDAWYIRPMGLDPEPDQETP